MVDCQPNVDKGEADARGKYEGGRQARIPLFLLRESTNRGQDTRCWPRRLYLRRMRGALSANHRKEGQTNNAGGAFTATRQRPNRGVVKDLGGIQWCLRENWCRDAGYRRHPP